MTSRRIALPIRLALAAVVVASLGARQGAQERRSSAVHHAQLPKIDAALSTDWSQHNLDAANTRFSSLDQINAANAGKLVLKWSYELPLPGSIREETPLVVDGVMYFNSGSKLYALNAATGTPIWTFQIEPAFSGGKRGPSYGDGKIYAAGPAEIYAVDAKSGKIVESFGDRGVLQIIAKALEFKYPGRFPTTPDARSLGYGIGAAPKYHNGMLYLGTSDSDSLITGGLLIAADAKTGAIKWVFNTVPQGPTDDGWDLAEKTWSADGPRQGGGIWTDPAIDPALGMIYVDAANPSPDYDGSARLGANLFTESILGLDLATGKLRWHYQTIHHDIWDKDQVAGPVLFDLSNGGRTVKALGSAGKICFMYVLDRETGQPINPIVETPVPTTTDVPGEKVWPTQPIPYTSRNVPQQPYCAIYPRVTDPLLAGRARPMFHPYQVNDFVIVSPGQDGGSDYGGPAFSPTTGLLYLSGKNDAASIKVKPVGQTLKPGPNSPGHFQNLAEVGRTGMAWNEGIAAYEPLTGRQVWYAEFPGWTNASLMVTAGNVVFHGTGGTGDLLAFDARTGEQIFRFAGHFGSPDAQRTGILASPMTYRVNGKQYVSVVATNTVLTFGLP